MPFEYKQPPPILAIQSLSTGKRLDLTDDFANGLEIPHKYAGPLPTGNEILTARKQAEVNKQLLALQLLGIPTPDKPDLRPKHKPPEPKLVAPIKPGMRPVGKLGDKLVMSIPADPIRRGY